MIYMSLNLIPHGSIPTPLPPNYKNLLLVKRVQHFVFILLTMKQLGNPKIDILFLILNLFK
jgi:hypothetical protein